MKILFLTDQFPFPLDSGGNQRSFHVLSALAEVHHVTLVSHEPVGGPQTAARFPIDCRVLTVKKSVLAVRVIRGIGQGLLGARSVFLSKNWSPRLLEAADRELKYGDYDAIHFNHLDTACYAMHRRWPVKKVFDTHNCLSVMAGQLAVSGVGWWRRRACAWEAGRLRDAEARICRAMDQNLVCSKIDRENFSALCPAGRWNVIPNGVDTEFFRPDDAIEEEQKSLVFTGAMDYFPNDRAALFFCHHVLPKVKTPNVRVYFVGSKPSDAVRALHDGRRVIVTGRVDDVRPYVSRAQVFVVPLQHGSGTRLKILEAFAMGKPVVSTTIGAEGIPAEHGDKLLLADSADQFASSIDLLLADRYRRKRLSTAARNFVVDQFDWRTIKKDVRNTYQEMSGLK